MHHCGGYGSAAVLSNSRAFSPSHRSLHSNRALLQLNIVDSAEHRSVVVTGPDWVLSESPVIADHFYNGETFDARIAPPGSTWVVSGARTAVVMPPPTQVLSSHIMPQVVAYETRMATNVSALHGGSSFIFDIGLNGAGVCTLTMPGPLPSGVNVTIIFAELQNPSGSGDAFVQYACPDVHAHDGGNCANQRYTYFTRGGTGPESYAASFSYSGARFAQVFGWPSAAPPTPELLTCDITSSGTSVVGTVEFNGTAQAPILNAIQAAIVRSQRSSLQSIPTDCPTREKRGWMADAHVTAPEASLNLFMAPLYENWLRTHADTLAVGCGGDPLKNCTCYKKDYSVPGNCPSPPPLYGAVALGADGSAGVFPNCYFCCSTWNSFGCTPETPAQNVSVGSIADKCGVAVLARSVP